MIVCPRCGQENPAGARFCNACSAPLDEAVPAAREERKVVTVLFADLVGFTARSEQLDPEDVRALLGPYHAYLREELERFGGTVEKFIGDAVMALFGAPVAHEDDPERAVRAALAIRDWVREQDELQLRIAVNTGEALIALGARPAEGEGMASGDVINTAARLQSAAPVNGILVGASTYRATTHSIEYREAEPVEAKGKSEPIPVWEALEARSRYGVDLADAKAPLVGRERELDRLRDALDVARHQRQLQLVTLVGVPGIGKSRLVHELFKVLESEPDFTSWRQGRSLPYGEGVSFWALAEIVKAQAGILESDSEEEAGRKLTAAVQEVADAGEVEWMDSRLRSLVGLQAGAQAGATQGESFSAWRGFLEAMADERPLVLVFEDLHWADDGLLDFVDQLVEWARSASILVLCTARPELLERRPGWGGGKANAATISLTPLEDDETARLLSSLLDRALLPAETQAQLLTRAAGNPLYAEQYARMLSEHGSVEELELPETVQGIIASRLDHLSESEKALLQDAAVVGKVFWLGSVSGDGARSQSEEALLRLERKELVQRARRSSVEGEAEYVFRHLLVRDVAYGQIPRAARAAKHRAAAEWVEGLGRPEDHAEMLASHYSRALEYSRATGADDPGLTSRARLALRDAGERAFALNAWPAAAGFFGTALELWPEEDPQRPQVMFRFGEAKVKADGTGIEVVLDALESFERAGEKEAAATAALVVSNAAWTQGDPAKRNLYQERALALVADDPDSPARLDAAAHQAGAAMLDGRHSEAIARIEELLPAAERLGLDRTRVRLLEVRGSSRCALGDARGFDDFEQAVALAYEVRAYTELHNALNNQATRLIAWGRLAESVEVCSAMEKNMERHGAATNRRWVQGIAVDLALVAGDWAKAREAADEYLAESGATSSHVLDSDVRANRALVLLGDGDLEGAIRDAEAALATTRGMPEGQLVSVTVAVAGRVFLEAGRRAEANDLLAELLEFGPPLVSLINDAKLVDAAWLAHDLERGEEYAALMVDRPEIPWAVAAAAICERDYLRAAQILCEIGYRPGEAYVRLRAARQLVEAGRRAEADAELQRALGFWREVGATRYVREGEALLAESA